MPIELSTSIECKIESLSPFGVMLEVENDSNISIADFPIEELRPLLAQHRLVLLRGFAEVSEQREFSRYCSSWGELLEWEFGSVLEVAEHASPNNYIFTNGSVPFHWDGAFADQTPWLQWFQCLEAPHKRLGGETLFCDTTLLWSSLSAETQELWRSIVIDYSTEKVVHYGGKIEAALVGRHPFTDESVIRFAEPANATTVQLNTPRLKIRGIDEPDHIEFINNLTKQIYDPRFVYTHEWQEGDFLVADNHALLHARTAYQSNQSRRLWRVHVL